MSIKVFKHGFVSLLFIIMFSGVLVSGLILLRALANYREAMAYVVKDIGLLGGYGEAVDYAIKNMAIGSSSFRSCDGVEFIVDIGDDVIAIRQRAGNGKMLVAKYIIMEGNKIKIYNALFKDGR